MPLETKPNTRTNPRTGITTHKEDIVEYKTSKKLGASAIKKEEIVKNILDEEDQLNLLASLIEEYLTSVGHTSPLFTYAQGEFAKIRNVLGA